MSDTGIIDTFLDTFSHYIDTGFGLLGGEVSWLSGTLIAIDLTIAGLFWAWGADEDVLQRLIKKTLYIGTFAFIIGNFSSLATILLQSFAGLGLKATGNTMSVADFLRPGAIGATGIDATMPLVNALAGITGPIQTLTNFPQVVLLLVAIILTLLAFFIMAVQVFVTVTEFKLVTLAGFVLLPFAFFGRTAFMAERVLGHIMSSGIKLLVLAVVTGIGTTLYRTLIIDAGVPVDAIDFKTSMTLVLAALSLLGLSMFGPGIANGIVAGGPQLGAGSAAGTAMVGGGMIVAGAGLAAGGAAAAGSALGTAAMGGARAAGATSAAWAAGSAGKSGASAIGGGAMGVGKAAGEAAVSPLRHAAESLKESFQSGRLGTPRTGGSGEDTAKPKGSEPPAWAKAYKLEQAARNAAHTLSQGDSKGAGAAVDLSEQE